MFLEISFNQKIFRTIKFVKYEKIDWNVESIYSLETDIYCLCLK